MDLHNTEYLSDKDQHRFYFGTPPTSAGIFYDNNKSKVCQDHSLFRAITEPSNPWKAEIHLVTDTNHRHVSFHLITAINTENVRAVLSFLSDTAWIKGNKLIQSKRGSLIFQDGNWKVKDRIVVDIVPDISVELSKEIAEHIINIINAKFESLEGKIESDKLKLDHSISKLKKDIEKKIIQASNNIVKSSGDSSLPKVDVNTIDPSVIVNYLTKFDMVLDGIIDTSTKTKTNSLKNWLKEPF